MLRTLPAAPSWRPVTATLTALLLLGGCGSSEPAPEPADPAHAAAPRAPAADDVAKRLLAAQPVDGPLRGMVLLADAPGTASYELARAIAPTMAMTPLATRGSLEALHLLAWGHGDLAIVQADVLQDPINRVVAGSADLVKPLYRAEVLVLVAPDGPVRELADLRGQRVAVGAAGSGAATTAQALFDAAGVYDVVFDRSGEAAALRRLRAGEVQAVVAVCGVPSPTLLRNEDLALLEVSADTVTRMQKLNPNYAAAKVRHGGREVATASIPALLVARSGAAAAANEAQARAADALARAHPKGGEAGSVSMDWADTGQGLSVVHRDPAAPLRVAAGPGGGSYAQVGAGIQRAIEGAVASVELLESEGSLHNLMLLAAAQADLAIVQEDVLLEALRSPATSPLLARVRLVAPLFAEQVHLMGADGAPGSLAELAGLRVGVGATGSGASVTARRLLRLAGVHDGAVRWALPASAALSKLRQGDLDAAFFVGVAPLEPVTASALRALPLAEQEGYAASALDPEAYPSLEEPVATVSTRALLLCRFNLDPDEVAAVVQALFANRHNLARESAVWGQLQLDALEGSLERKDEGLRLHPGVERAHGAGIALDSAHEW